MAECGRGRHVGIPDAASATTARCGQKRQRAGHFTRQLVAGAQPFRCQFLSSIDRKSSSFVGPSVSTTRDNPSVRIITRAEQRSRPVFERPGHAPPRTRRLALPHIAGYSKSVGRSVGRCSFDANDD